MKLPGVRAAWTDCARESNRLRGADDGGGSDARLRDAGDGGGSDDRLAACGADSGRTGVVG